MQVVVFDKFFKCAYRLHNVPEDWNFVKVAEALELTHDPREYQAIRFAEYSEFCIDDYEYKDGQLLLTSCGCTD